MKHRILLASLAAAAIAATPTSAVAKRASDQNFQRFHASSFNKYRNGFRSVRSWRIRLHRRFPPGLFAKCLFGSFHPGFRGHFRACKFRTTGAG